MKKAIVIGATSGIGKGISNLLVENLITVGITGRRTNLLQEMKTEHPNFFEIATLDITEVNTIDKKLNELVKTLGGLDLLIICSGTGDLNEKLAFNIEQKTIETNILGFTCVADWAFNYFEKQKSGHLVGISSVGGLRGSRFAPAYNASKAFQINYLEGLRQKAKKSKMPITITDVRPGFVNTEMAKGEGLFWVAPVDKTAKQIFAAIRNKKKVVYVTKRWKLVAGLLKRIPNSLYEKM